jgi:hypothetical protein
MNRFLQQKKNFRSATLKTTALKSFLMAVGCSSLLIAHSQSNSVLVLAEKYFAAGEYYTLLSNQSRTAILPCTIKKEAALYQ